MGDRFIDCFRDYFGGIKTQLAHFLMSWAQIKGKHLYCQGLMEMENEKINR